MSLDLMEFGLKRNLVSLCQTLARGPHSKWIDRQINTDHVFPAHVANEGDSVQRVHEPLTGINRNMRVKIQKKMKHCLC